MFLVLVKPTEPTAPNYDSDLALYESDLDGVRKMASPNLVEPITADDMPSEVLEVFLYSAEQQVLRDVGLTVDEVRNMPRDSERFKKLRSLVRKRLAINISPNLPALLRESFLSYAHDEQWERIGWKERQAELQEQYTDELIDFNPDAVDLQGLPLPTVVLTDSKLG